MEETNYCKFLELGREERAKSFDEIVHEKKNCWEYMKCGCQVNGKNAKEMGVCPASIERKLNGTNDGMNGGRACWAIAGTKCGTVGQCGGGHKNGDCSDCVFVSYVRIQQGETFSTTEKIIEKIFADLKN